MCECVCSLWSSLLETKKQLEINLHSQARASVHMYTHTHFIVFTINLQNLACPQQAVANQGGSCKLQGVREKHTVSCLSFSFSRNIGAQVCHIQKSNKVNVNVVLELEKKIKNPDGVLVI